MEITVTIKLTPFLGRFFFCSRLQGAYRNARFKHGNLNQRWREWLWTWVISKTFRISGLTPVGSIASSKARRQNGSQSNISKKSLPTVLLKQFKQNASTAIFPPFATIGWLQSETHGWKLLVSTPGSKGKGGCRVGINGWHFFPPHSNLLLLWCCWGAGAQPKPLWPLNYTIKLLFNAIVPRGRFRPGTRRQAIKAHRNVIRWKDFLDACGVLLWCRVRVFRAGNRKHVEHVRNAIFACWLLLGCYLVVCDFWHLDNVHNDFFFGKICSYFFFRKE